MALVSYGSSGEESNGRFSVSHGFINKMMKRIWMSAMRVIQQLTVY